VLTKKSLNGLRHEKQELPMNLLQRSLKIVQNQLIQLVQNKGIDPELWETYVLLAKEMY